MTLRLRPVGRFRAASAPDDREHGTPGATGLPESDLYEVDGLPAGHQAFVGRVGGRWQILRFEASEPGAWSGKFSTAENALASLQTLFADEGGTSGAVH